jgi:hypothetical protein
MGRNCNKLIEKKRKKRASKQSSKTDVGKPFWKDKKV